MSSITVKRPSPLEFTGSTLHDAIDLTSEDELTLAPQKTLDHGGLPQSIVNIWTSDQRIFLFFVRRRYENSWEDTAKLFNQAFASDLHRRGFTDGLVARTLQAQFGDGPRYQKEDFRRVLTTPFADLSIEFWATERKVKQVANQQWIDLRTKDHDTWPGSYHISGQKRKRRASLESIEEDADEAPRPALARKTSQQSTRSARLRIGRDQLSSIPSPQTRVPKTLLQTPRTLQLLTPSSTASSSSFDFTASTRKEASTPRRRADVLGGLQSHDELPFLLFRTWDATSHGLNSPNGFASGLHLTTPFLEENDDRFLQFAEDHIWKRPDPSPLISLTASFPSALKKAFEKTTDQAENETETTGKHRITIAVLDARAVATNTRLYHANPTVGVLAGQGRLPRRYYARFEFWAWQRAQGIVGQATLEEFEAWKAEDTCLGQLFRSYDLSRCSVGTFRQRCSKSDVIVNEELGHSIASLAKLFRPNTTFYDPFLRDFVRTILQNLDIATDFDAWLEDTAFCNALKDSLKDSVIALPKTLATPNTFRPRPEPSHRPQAKQSMSNRQCFAHARRSIRAWSTTSSEFQDLAHIEDMGASVKQDDDVDLEDNDDITAKAESEIDDDIVDIDHDDEEEERINTPSTDSEADNLLHRFARLTTPSTPSPDHGCASGAIFMEDEDEMDTSSSLAEARSLLNLFRRPSVPSTSASGHNSHNDDLTTQLSGTVNSTANSPVTLQSPYESQKGARFRTGLVSPGSPLASREPQVERIFQTPPIPSATTNASAALHDVVNGKQMDGPPAANKRKFTIITAADRQAAMG